MKRILLTVLALAMVTALAACAAAPAATEVAAAAEPEQTESVESVEKGSYILVGALWSDPYFNYYTYGMEMAGEEFGVDVECVGPADYDIDGMITAFEEAIAKKPDGIVCPGFEESLNPVIEEAINAGIPVATIDADLPTSARLSFVGTGNTNAGYMIGQALAESLGGSGKVLLCYKPGQSNLEERANGCKNALANYPGIEILEVVDSQNDATVAAQNMSAAFQKYPDADGVACLDGTGPAGVVTAIKEADLAGKIAVATFDVNDEVLEAISDGIVNVTLAQNTALMPYYAVQELINYKTSNVQISNDDAAAGIAALPASIDTGCTLVTPENVAYFMD